MIHFVRNRQTMEKCHHQICTCDQNRSTEVSE